MEHAKIKKVTVVLSENKKQVLDAIKSVTSGVQYVEIYGGIEQAFPVNYKLSESTLHISKNSGIKFTRDSKKMLLLCKKEMLNTEYVSDFRNIYGNLFDVYVETIDDIYKYIEKCEVNTFAFKNYIYELFKTYKDIDYLII